MDYCTPHCPPHCDKHHHGHHGGEIPTVYQPQVIVTQPAPAAVGVIVGSCPACRTGLMQDEFTICGILMGILFFPLGIICCMMMRERRCTHCGATFH